MDVNIVYECIGYGASRAISSSRFAEASTQVPARFILETARDPVAYCIEAYAQTLPERADTIDGEGRNLIRARLEREAGLRRRS